MPVPPAGVGEETITVPVYGNLGLLSLLGGPGDAHDSAISSARKVTLAALLMDPKCLGYLSRFGADPLSILKNISITHGYIGGQSIQAQTATTSSPDFSQQVPVSASITVNDNGWFFTMGAKATDGTPTGTPRFQGQVLIHELGHASGVLLPDGEGPNAVQNQAINDMAIKLNCGNAIQSLSNK